MNKLRSPKYTSHFAVKIGIFNMVSSIWYLRWTTVDETDNLVVAHGEVYTRQGYTVKQHS